MPPNTPFCCFAWEGWKIGRVEAGKHIHTSFMSSCHQTPPFLLFRMGRLEDWKGGSRQTYPYFFYVFMPPNTPFFAVSHGKVGRLEACQWRLPSIPSSFRPSTKDGKPSSALPFFPLSNLPTLNSIVLSTAYIGRFRLLDISLTNGLVIPLPVEMSVYT